MNNKIATLELTIKVNSDLEIDEIIKLVTNALTGKITLTVKADVDAP